MEILAKELRWNEMHFQREILISKAVLQIGGILKSGIIEK